MQNGSRNSNGKNGTDLFQLGILILIGVVIVSGSVSVAVSGGIGEGAGLIMGLCTLACTQLFSILQSHRAANKVAEVAAKADTAAEKVAEVAVKQDAASAAASQRAAGIEGLAAKIETVSAKVDEVYHATNSLTDRLVETTREGSHAAGVKEEQDRRNKEERDRHDQK